MARSRNIKPGFFLNDRLAEVEPLGRILFAGLWTIADREGRLEDRPKKIKAEVLAYDVCDVDQLLTELHQKGFILRYEVGGERYIWIKNFLKHQNPHKKEALSTLPSHETISTAYSPTEEQISSGNSGTFREKEETCPADSFNMIPDSPNLIPESFNTQPNIGKSCAAATVEKEFGRLLSPMELDQVGQWEDKYGFEIVLHALKITVLKGVFRLKYMDAILSGWEKASLTTYRDVLEYESMRKGKGRVPPGVHLNSERDFNALYEL